MTLTANPKLCDWAAYWLETYVRPVAKPSGYEHYHDNLHKHILPKLGDLRLNKLTPSVVQRFLNDVAEHGNLRNGGPLSAKSIKNMRVVLDVCCKRAVAEGYMQANPVPLTVYKHCTSKPVDVMSDEDQRIQNPLCMPIDQVMVFSCANRCRYGCPVLQGERSKTRYPHHCRFLAELTSCRVFMLI